MGVQWCSCLPVQPTTQHNTMLALRLAALLAFSAFLAQATRSTGFARRAKRLHSSDKARAALPKLELLKEASNTIGHEPDHISQHRYYKHFWNNKKKVALAKKLKLGHRGKHQAANTNHDNDNIHLQQVDHHTAISKEQPKTFKQVLKKKLLKPSKKMDKMYKKLLTKEKLG